MKTRYCDILVLLFMFKPLQSTFCHTAPQNNVLQGTTSCRTRPSGSSGRQYRFMYLVQQWEVSVCDEKPRSCIKPARSGFSIRGLWPSSYSRESLLNCRGGTKFVMQKISDLQPRLNIEWPSLLHENNTELWREEWESRGVCSEPALSQHDFFRAALELKKRYNILDMLANQGILPLSNVYGIETVSNAIRSATGFRPIIGCNLFNKIPQLSLIFLCFDYNATNIIHCPPRTICRYKALLFPYDPYR